MDTKYLPIGSVVLLNNDKKVMIIGYYSIQYNNTIKMNDYLGCSYPEGMLLPNDLISFNHDDIEQVIFTGYVDDSYEHLNDNMNGQLANNYNDLKKDNFSSNISSTKSGTIVYHNLKESLIDPVYDILNQIEIDNPFNSEVKFDSDTAEMPKVDTTDETINSDKLFTIEEDEEVTE